MLASLILFLFYDKPMINLFCLLVVSLMMGVKMFWQVGGEIYSILIILVLVGGLFVTISFVILFSGNSLIPHETPNVGVVMCVMLLGWGLVYIQKKQYPSWMEVGELSPCVSAQFSKFCSTYIFLIIILLLVLPLIDELLEETGGGSFYKM